MDELSEDLISHPMPNRPGWWAYRLLPDGHLLEVELTREEWFQLHERYRDSELSKIFELNQDPLNQAALVLINKSGGITVDGEIHLISLARLALDDDVPNWGDRLMALADWSSSLGTMRTAMKVLKEAEIGTEDLLSDSPEDAANLILNYLL